MTKTNAIRKYGMLRSSALCPLLGIGMLVGGALSSSAAIAATDCTAAALTALSVPNMTVAGASAVAASGGTPAFCRVTGSVMTNGEGAGPNQAGFQIDLPGFWNGKFLFLGGGGLDGTVVLADGTPQELSKGYATASTNSGHLNSDGTFGISAPGVPNRPGLVDYFYRARHEVGIAAKGLVRAFYNARKISYSYFDGCSNGGRQGLMEASRYPDDYDGIISGAPWMDALGTSLWEAKNIRALIKAYIPYSLFPQINAAILGQCDAADGVRDGLIQNPARCAFNPDSLVPSVLTHAQADAIKTIISSVTDSTGHLIYPGSPVSDLFGTYAFASVADDENSTPAPDPTAAQPWGSPPLGLTSTSPINWHLVYNIIDYLALYQPDNDLNSDAFEKNGVISTSLRKFMYSNLKGDLADDPALVANFLNKGKKLILYHGYSNSIISPYRTVLFYKLLAGVTGGFDKLQTSARLFMVPGMGHCGGGSSPNTFGNGAAPAGYPVDPQHDVLSALENWVENGGPPASLIAAHFTGATPNVIDRTMPLCPFPSEAHYNGRGDVNDAASWKCNSDTDLLKTGVNGKQAGVFGPADQPRFPPDVIH